MTQLSSRHFQRLVSVLKKSRKTCTVVEQSCGGLIQTSILAQPGASSVFYGGTVAYNTRKAKPLLLNDENFYGDLMQSHTGSMTQITDGTNPKRTLEEYIHSKVEWTAKSSVAYCQAMGTDYAIAEGGATGPTFPVDNMIRGFSVISVAGKEPDGSIRVLKQQIIHSFSSNREDNMRYFANEAAVLASNIVETQHDAAPNELDNTQSIIGEQSSGKQAWLDRATHLRRDTKALDDLKSRAVYLVLNDLKILMKLQSSHGGTGRQLAYLRWEEIPTDSRSGRETFLGLIGGETPVFSIDLDDATDMKWPPDTEFLDTRNTAPLLDRPLENELALHATAYAQWQRRSAFCNICGGATVLIEGGSCRRCRECNTSSWPRQDPSIICAVSSRNGEHILLARSPRHGPKVHTVLAGFVEAGESLESAVAREVREETGIQIDEGSVKYVGSQPWPFPQSCMFGFTATADDSQQLVIDQNELVSARWFNRSEVQQASEVDGPTMNKAFAQAVIDENPDLPLLIPPNGVIARRLINKWVSGEW